MSCHLSSWGFLWDNDKRHEHHLEDLLLSQQSICGRVNWMIINVIAKRSKLVNQNRKKMMIFDLFSSSVFFVLSMIHVFHLKSESLKDIWVGILQQIWEDLSCIAERSEVKRMNIGRRKKHRKPFKNLIWIDWKKSEVYWLLISDFG